MQLHKILENAVHHMLSNDGRADEFFHEFMLMRARQIHEAYRREEDFDMAKFESEEYFTEDDLSDLEGSEGFNGDEHAEGAEGDEHAEGEDNAEGTEGAADDLSDDLGVGDEEGIDTTNRLDDIEDQLADLTAEFEQIMSALDGDGDDDLTGAQGEDAEGSQNGDDVGAQGEDAEGDEFGPENDDETEQKVGESVNDDDDFEDITESVISELEKVLVTMTDGKEIGKGGTVTQNKNSALPQKKLGDRQGGSPVETKFTAHDGFEREQAPAVKTVAPTKNVRKNTMDGVTKVGAPKNSESNVNTKSVIPGK